MIHLVIALADKDVSDRTKEYIRRLPPSVFAEYRERKFFSGLVANLDIFTASEAAEINAEELLKWFTDDEFNVFKTISEEAQIAKINAILQEDNKRKVCALTKRFETEVLSGVGNFSNCLGRLSEEISKLPNFKRDECVGDGVEELLSSALEFISKTGEDLPLISLPYKRMNDELCGGFRKTDVVAISGQTEGGKTLFAQNLVNHWAKRGYKILYVSTEMSKRNLVERWMLQEAWYANMSLSRTAMIAPQDISEYDKISSLGGIVSSWDIDFSILKDDIKDIKFDMIKKDYDIVVVDHFHSLNGCDDVASIKPLLQTFKKHAVEKNCLVVLLAQHSKDGTYGKNKCKEPHLGMIRNSAQFIDMADRIMTIWEPDVLGLVKDMHLLKDRHTGQRGSVCSFDWIKNRCILKEKYYG